MDKPEILKIKDKEPEMIFENPKPPPTELQPRITKHFLPKPREKTLYDVYPSTDKPIDRVEDLGVVNKKGRPMAPQKTNESSEQYIERIKKGTGYQNINSSNKKDNKTVSNPPMTFSTIKPSPVKTRKQRADEKQEEINNNIKMNQMDSFL